MPTRVNHVNGASQARIEGVDGTQQFQWTIGIRDRRLEERGFIGSALAAGIARTGVPCGRNDRLVVLDRLVLNLDPVPQRPTRRLEETETPRVLGPGLRVPLFSVVNAHVPAFQIVPQFLDPADQLVREKLCLERTRGNATESRKQRSWGSLELCQSRIDQGFNVLLTGSVGDEQSRQRADFHGQILITRGLQPGILLIHCEEIVGRLGSRVFRIGFSFEGVFGSLISSGILVPGVGYIFCDIRWIDRMNLGQIAIQEDTSGRKKLEESLIEPCGKPP